MDWKFWKKDDDPLGDLPDLSSDFSPGNQAPTDPFDAPMESGPSPDPMSSVGQPPTMPDQGAPQPKPQQMYTPENSPQGVGWEPEQDTKQTTQQNNLQYDVIIARLDGMKAQLDSINQRLANLESQQQPRKQRGPWYQ